MSDDGLEFAIPDSARQPPRFQKRPHRLAVLEHGETRPSRAIQHPECGDPVAGLNRQLVASPICSLGIPILSREVQAVGA